ncbi:hypothetical protein F2P56_023792 [Juglans regia]|uniref:GDSL esterase/lipase At5g03980-like n=1 Tax=Juglans regia TaxID=51240 RepID=A0A833X058_JUGRE|nr:hypothetical protein F2P56_023792 [Juglans regia]
MTSTQTVLSLILTLNALLLLFLLPQCTTDAHSLMACKFNAIYNVGDSMSDTGNLVRENSALPFARLPYGETFFKSATGRCSNALAVGVPFLHPYLNKDALFLPCLGENFAVAGSTALSTNALAKKNILSPVTNSSLDVQLDWMSSHFNIACFNDQDCVKKHNMKALFMVGEIGGNDYNYAFFQGKPVEEVKAMVPEVVQAIKDAVKRVIGYGAVRVVVPGNFPIGCFPIYLTTFQTNNAAAYDEFHCLKWLNSFSTYHNDKLKQAIEDLRKENPNVIIAYGDYYNAFQWVYQHAPLLGFDVASVQKSCCGAGGYYNFGMTKMCGAPNVPVCPNPEEHISWDGIHLTEKAYQYMAYWLIRDILPKLNCINIV